MHDDFAAEPVRGLPERPPKGEEILWQGRPDWRALAKSALAFWWVTGYFAALALWRFAAAVDQVPLGEAAGAAAPVLFLGGITGGLLALTAFIQARATVYTLTSRRIVMRIGAALTVTVNLPFTQIASADLDLRGDGTGTVVLSPCGRTQLGYLVLWPHLRPWHVPAKPALRCIPDAKRVADMVAEAASARVSAPQISRRSGRRGQLAAAVRWEQQDA